AGSEWSEEPRRGGLHCPACVVCDAADAARCSVCAAWPTAECVGTAHLGAAAESEWGVRRMESEGELRVCAVAAVVPNRQRGRQASRPPGRVRRETGDN